MLPSSLLKVTTLFGVWTIIWLPIAILIARLINWQPSQPLIVKQKLILLASLYVLAPGVLWWKIGAEKLSLVDLGWHWQLNTLTSLGLGLILSLAGLIVVFTWEFLLGLVNWQWHNRQLLLPLILPILLLALGVSLIEELIFRGYVFTTLVIEYPYWLAATISSIIFALLHLVWERKTTIPQLPGLWLMGMVLVGARLVDNNSLGLAWGLHTGWIWGLSCLDSAQLITYNTPDKNWIAGIYQQPLAGIAGIFCLLFTGSVLWLFTTVSF